MRRKPSSRPRSHSSRSVRWLLLLLFAVVVWMAAGVLFDCLFQNAVAAHGTLLFLPDG